MTERRLPDPRAAPSLWRSLSALAHLLPLLLVASAPARPVGGDRVFRSEPFGLRVTAPEDGWIFYPETNPAPKLLFKLTIFPRGTPGIPSVGVFVSDASSAADENAASDRARKALEAQGATEFEPRGGAVGGREAPGFRARMKNPAGGMLHLRCLQRIEHGFVYSFLCARAVEDTDADAKLDRILASVEFPEPKIAVESAETASWRKLAAKCAADLPWASAWPEAASRAKAENRLVLVLFQNYAPLDLPHTMRSGALMDPDVASLVEERFVVLELGPSDEAPFRDPKVFGMGKHTFGSAFLFVDADGHVVAQCGILDASFLDEFARGVLAERTETATEDARAAFRRGDLGAARKALEGIDSGEGHRLRAAILRRERKGQAAIEELNAAKRVAPKELEPELLCDEAVLLLRMKRSEEAAAVFERVVREWPDHPRACEAAFWLGSLDVLGRGAALGSARWRDLARDHPGSPWAWKAAANLLQQGAFATGTERTDWPEADLVRCATNPAPSPLARKDAGRAEREAVAWLVANQRGNGSWWNPMDGFGLGANLYTPACSAICAMALLAHPEEKGARAGAEKAVEYALDLDRAGKLKPGEDLAGVYSIWNRTFVAWALARSLRAKIGDSKAISAALQELVDSVVASQDHRGGWPYVHLPGDEGGSGIDPSASFVTAGVVLALLDVREAGEKVPKESIERALDFLARLREPDGTFRYLPDVPGALVDGVHPEACGRGPVCTLALARGGRRDSGRVKEVLELFLSHRGVFQAEWGKTLCHTGPEGFGAHYLFYDYLFASAALKELPSAERERFRGPLLADVLAARLADGSFCDLPGLGRPYATAMAALCLGELGP